MTKQTKPYQGRAATGGSDTWETPPWLFYALAKNFGNFDLDAAASETNKLCDEFYSEQDSGLTNAWKGQTFCNPPYSLLLSFCRKAAIEYTKEVKPILLIPARVDTLAWHECIFDVASTVWFIEGRLKMYMDGREAENSAGFPSAIIQWDSDGNKKTKYKTIPKELLLKWKKAYNKVASSGV